MRLYFLRHAEAVDDANDAARELTEQGRKDARAVGRFLKGNQIAFDAAYTSPLVRAEQTAKIVLGLTNDREPVKLQIVDALLNEAMDFPGWLQRLPEAKHVLFVGHAPSMPAHVCKLLASANAVAFKMSKGGLACLKTDDRKLASLKFYVTPKVLPD